MKDPRLTTLINNLLDYSVELKEGEKVYIEWKGNNTQTFVRELIKGIVHRKATPVWIYNDESILRHLLKNCSEEQIQDYGRFHLEWMKKVDVFLSVRGSNNPFDLADIPNEKLDLYRKHFWQPVHAE